MSIRAYRVIKIECAQPNSFNLWHDGNLVNFLDREYGFFEGMNEGGGLTEVPVEGLKEALAKPELELGEDVIEVLKRDIEAAEQEGEQYVQYYCY
jgi:hypothetical protein